MDQKLVQKIVRVHVLVKLFELQSWIPAGLTSPTPFGKILAQEIENQ